MDEALRRAYLAAMEIPVWIPRGEKDPWDAAPVPVESVAQARSAATSGAHLQAAPLPAGAGTGRPTPAGARAQAILGDLGSAPAQRSRATQPSVPRATAPTADAERFTLLIARAGGTLFVDDSTGERPTRSDMALLSELVFVLEREKLQPEPSSFAWPLAAGRAAGQARDAVLGRIAKIAEGMALRRLVLMGDLPVRLVLGEEATGRGPRVQRLERPACAVLAIPSLARMLADPDAKRIAWQTLRLPHG